MADELRATIGDTVEAHAVADPDAAEREVLTEMGDPIRLAARYADRPLALIGPELYPAYVRLLRILLTTVLPVVTAGMVVIDVLDNNDLGSAIGAGIGALLTIGAQMIAWLTVVFALVERSAHRDDVAASSGTWTPDDLPEPKQSNNRVTSACASAVWNALLLGLIIWQHTAKPYRFDGQDRLAVLDPALWSGWIWPILAGFSGIVALELSRIAVRRWTIALAGWYAVAEALVALPLAWILYQHKFFNEFLNDTNGNWTILDEFYTVAALGVLAVSAIEVVKRFRAARASERATGFRQ